MFQAIAGDNLPLVTLRGQNWNTYWKGFVRLSERLEELGVPELLDSS